MTSLTTNWSIARWTNSDPASLVSESTTQGDSIEAALNKISSINTNVSALDSVSTAQVGTIAYMTAPGTGVESIKWEAYSGSGSSLKWRIVDTVVADTLAHLNTFIAAVAGTTDLTFRLGGEAYVSTTGMRLIFTSTAGAYRVSSSDFLIPTNPTTGVTIGADGIITSTAQSTVGVRNCFLSPAKEFEVSFDLTTSAAAGVDLQLSTGGTVANTAYDDQRDRVNIATYIGSQALNQTSGEVTGIGIAGRHIGKIRMINPNVAAETWWLAEWLASANPMAAGSGIGRTGGLHRTATAYDGLTFLVASGTITLNRLTIRPLT